MRSRTFSSMRFLAGYSISRWFALAKRCSTATAVEATDSRTGSNKTKSKAMNTITDEVKKRGLQICQSFVGGTWASLSMENFAMEYQHGGLSNMLYICSVSDKVFTKPPEPRKVMVRLFGKIIGSNPDVVVTDQVIFALLAEKSLVPKLYGVFTGGRVEEFVESRSLLFSELKHPDISQACGRVMARIHRIDMPLAKEPCWIFDTMTRYLNEALNNSPLALVGPETNAKLAKLYAYDLANELTTLKGILSRVSSPVVFSHNDLQGGNILFSQDDKGWQLLPIDFEYASYNYRGFDFGNHFCEWCYNYKVDDFPYFSANLDNFPNKEQQFNFFRAYVDECASSGGYPGANGDSVSDRDLEHMALEANTYALASHFMWALWSIVQAQISTIRFGYLEYAQARLDGYYQQKKLVLAALNNHSKEQPRPL